MNRSLQDLNVVFTCNFSLFYLGHHENVRLFLLFLKEKGQTCRHVQKSGAGEPCALGWVPSTTSSTRHLSTFATFVQGEGLASLGGKSL